MRTMNFLKMIGHIINDRRFILAAVVALVSAVPYAGSVVAREKALNGPPPIGDVIAEWHQEAVRLTILPASGLAPVQQSQAMTIVQVSVHDAVNGITREHETYLSRLPAPAGASPEAAAIAASYHALRNLFPSHSTSLDALFANSLAAHGLSINDPGIGYGITAATRILTARMNDGSGQAQFNYVAPGAGLPGVWVPLTSLPALLPGWGNTTTWVLRSSSQFRPEAPPALNSERYARDYNEVKIIGAANSPLRTGEQTQIATFWLGSPVAIWSQPLAQLNALQGGLSLSQRARTFALMYIAAADSGIACWEAKYFYNFWRPQPAIQRGIEDGNPLTAPDPTWTPLVPTPRHPEYPSGHTSNSTAMVAVLQMAFGDRPGVPINSTITGITRQWSSFGQGLDEVIDARVYSGIHFRTADEAGSRMGGQIAQFVVMHALRPCRGQGARCS